jgi:S-phase kinase-associated protein 1
MLPKFVKIRNIKTPDRPAGRVFIVERKAAEHSAVLRQLFKDYDESGSADLSKEVIPIDINVSDNSLGIIFEWATKYKDMRKAEDNDAPVTDRGLLTFTDWEKKVFDEISELGLYEVLIATNYLDIKRLHELGCKTVANMLVGKSPSEIRRILNIPNDFTPEEEAEIAKETAWIRGRDGSETSTPEAIAV